MAMRVALVACTDATEGPWTFARGNETAIKIVHLVSGERVVVDMKVGDLSENTTFDQPGTFPLPWKRMEKYRVIKQVDDGVRPSPTTVEIVLNGTSQGVLGETDDH